ncbi:PTS sugar transporter subunit IIA [Olsenella uli]|uniref:PTS sugar transporter subunit IIA n=1 Tax=Olsenella uli TaxID=133926 RepID=UPI00195C0178|nr:PTS sugar transporter subunit IIA [Olsenella uli]MBM6817285.1 PTS sugar transporter subunit IIA [Olsenella uli]
MVGIVVMTHGGLAEGLVSASEVIMGPAQQVRTLSLGREGNVDDLTAEFSAALEEVDTGDGVLVLCDLFGGSPCNVASMGLRTARNYHLVSGASLPMLIEAINSRDEGLDPAALAQRCIDAAHEGIRHINELLAQA